MKIGVSLGLALVMGVFALSGVSINAYAVDANHSGTICKNYNAGEVTDIDYIGNGTRNLNASSRFVICPLVRSPTSTNQVNVYVDGVANNGTTITCTLNSYEYDGSFLGSQSFTLGGSFSKSVTVPGSYWGTASVLCLLPGSTNGIIYDVDVVQ